MAWERRTFQGCGTFFAISLGTRRVRPRSPRADWFFHSSKLTRGQKKCPARENIEASCRHTSRPKFGGYYSCYFNLKGGKDARNDDRLSGEDFLLVLVHLARGDAEVRQEQAKGLPLWAADQKLPVIRVGDFNFDYEFATSRGTAAFDEFLLDNVWK